MLNDNTNANLPLTEENSEKKEKTNCWLDNVEEMGKWYQKNIHTYQGGTSGKATHSRKMYDCPLVNKKVGDDCSGFVCACLWKHGVDVPLSGSYSFVGPEKAFEKKLNDAGFNKMKYDANKLIPGDIMAKNGHVEIYFAPKKSYAWGNIHDGLNGHTGMPCWMAKLPYTTIWRKTI